VQIVAMIIDTYVLITPTNPKNNDIKGLLVVENVVNIVEFTFYVWMVYNFSRIKNITKFRYYDWAITTPTMLFTYMMYTNILKKKENNEPQPLMTLVLEEKYTIALVFVLNWMMLLFGFLGETGKLPTNLSTALGFIPFIAMFYIIYTKYAQFTKIGSSTFVYFVSIWAIYGIAALMSYNVKNVMYNILDLFSKNFFALFLAYMVAFR
jgi:hypothetical protein